MRKRFLLTFILTLTLSYGAFAQPQNASSPEIKRTGEVNVLDDFEDRSMLKNWEGTLFFSNEFPAHSKSCLKLSASQGQSLWMESEKIPSDWSGYDCLKFDIYNSSSDLYYGSIQVFDDLATDREAEANGQSYLGAGKILMNKGWNHYEFLIHDLMVEQGDRPLALDHIRKLRFSFGSIDHPLYIDNLRLVSGTENSQTASHIDPHDCMVVIDNRYVYPRLADPGILKTNPAINQLRQQAVETVENLEREISVASLQGYQTLYQRIPLVTARVGLGIRSKLVWFQNEEEETKIYKYIIKSCSETVLEIDATLSAQRSKEPVNEPENDVSFLSKYQSFYVPPYSAFNGLKPIDGFYRDKTGNPVIVFSMLQLNKGPLMDYFAPFNHRIESFTVGGGSRYNIEKSPVYKAFHEYSGTHRVGWDGWCGHLIKDRWSMGGKKEDVVICLESPHIRQAVLEYMKLHYKEWIDNPDLLYNIMAYELQYICYCDRSQQMFRNWLKIKYSVVSGLNQTWKTKYRSFNEIKAPEAHNARPAADVNRAAWYDWASFNTRRFTDYMQWIKKEMKKLDPFTPICAGGTSSMLNSANSVTGIDEEMIINGVDDVILNESGGSPIFSDLLLSLSETKKVMVDPEMGSGTHNILLQFLHGKSDISKFLWAEAPSVEFPKMNQASLPHSKDVSLSDIDEVLRISLDVRRLSSEIAAFTQTEPEVAILYSKTSVIQVPPHQIQAGRTPYIDAVYSTWEGSRFLGCRVGFVSEKQILAGKLKKFKLLIVPAVKFIGPEVVAAIRDYIKGGGTAVIIPESFMFNQYAQENNKIAEFGIKITDVTLPPVLGVGEKVQNYDQSSSQKILHANIERSITTLDKGIFSNTKPLVLHSDGLIQTIAPGRYHVLAEFDNGKPAIVNTRIGGGDLYYLAAPLKSEDYHLLLSPIAEHLGLKRPVVGIDKSGNLITGVEVRSVERDADYLVYACNLTAGTVEFSLKGERKLGVIQNLRSLRRTSADNIRLDPFQETIFRVEK
jgi:hypothetical protein